MWVAESTHAFTKINSVFQSEGFPQNQSAKYQQRKTTAVKLLARYAAVTFRHSTKNSLLSEVD